MNGASKLVLSDCRMTNVFESNSWTCNGGSFSSNPLIHGWLNTVDSGTDISEEVEHELKTSDKNAKINS